MTTEQILYVDDQCVTAESSGQKQVINQHCVGIVSLNQCFQGQEWFAPTVLYLCKITTQTKLITAQCNMLLWVNISYYTVKFRLWLLLWGKRGLPLVKVQQLSRFLVFGLGLHYVPIFLIHSPPCGWLLTGKQSTHSSSSRRAHTISCKHTNISWMHFHTIYYYNYLLSLHINYFHTFNCVLFVTTWDHSASFVTTWDKIKTKTLIENLQQTPEWIVVTWCFRYEIRKSREMTTKYNFRLPQILSSSSTRCVLWNT